MKKSIYSIAIIGLFAACSSSENPTSDENNVSTSSLIEVSNAQFEANQLSLASPQPFTFTSTIKCTGKVDVPPEFMASISTYYQGYVKGIKLIEGEFVTKGQLLFVLENPEYLQMQQDFLEAKEQLAYLKSEYDRQKTLANENISAQKNYLKAKSDYGVTSTRYEALKKKLSLMGISTASLDNSNLHSTIRITAPISGYVSSINVSQGKVLSPNEVALIITNTEHLHVEIMVFEKDILKVVKGQKIHYKFSGSSKELGGEVHLVSRAVTQGAGAISVHGHINNSDELKNMYPGMFVEAEIITEANNQLGVPESSVIEIEGKFYVLRLKEKNAKSYNFEKKEVNIVDKSNGYVHLEGIKEEDQVLSKGAFDLITE